MESEVDSAPMVSVSEKQLGEGVPSRALLKTEAAGSDQFVFPQPVERGSPTENLVPGSSPFDSPESTNQPPPSPALLTTTTPESYVPNPNVDPTHVNKPQPYFEGDLWDLATKISIPRCGGAHAYGPVKFRGGFGQHTVHKYPIPKTSRKTGGVFHKLQHHQQEYIQYQQTQQQAHQLEKRGQRRPPSQPSPRQLTFKVDPALPHERWPNNRPVGPQPNNRVRPPSPIIPAYIQLPHRSVVVPGLASPNRLPVGGGSLLLGDAAHAALELSDDRFSASSCRQLLVRDGRPVTSGSAHSSASSSRALVRIPSSDVIAEEMYPSLGIVGTSSPARSSSSRQGRPSSPPGNGLQSALSSAAVSLSGLLPSTLTYDPKKMHFYVTRSGDIGTIHTKPNSRGSAQRTPSPPVQRPATSPSPTFKGDVPPKAKIGRLAPPLGFSNTHLSSSKPTTPSSGDPHPRAKDRQRAIHHRPEQYVLERSMLDRLSLRVTNRSSPNTFPMLEFARANVITQHDINAMAKHSDTVFRPLEEVLSASNPATPQPVINRATTPLAAANSPFVVPTNDPFAGPLRPASSSRLPQWQSVPVESSEHKRPTSPDIDDEALTSGVEEARLMPIDIDGQTPTLKPPHPGSARPSVVSSASRSQFGTSSPAPRSPVTLDYDTFLSTLQRHAEADHAFRRHSRAQPDASPTSPPQASPPSSPTPATVKTKTNSKKPMSPKAQILTRLRQRKAPSRLIKVPSPRASTAFRAPGRPALFGAFASQRSSMPGDLSSGWLHGDDQPRSVRQDREMARLSQEMETQQNHAQMALDVLARPESWM